MTSRALARLRTGAPDLRDRSELARPVGLLDRVTATAARPRRRRVAAGAAFGAVLLAAAGAALAWGQLRTPEPDVGPVVPPSIAPTADPLRFSVGDWAGHGRQMTVRADGDRHLHRPDLHRLRCASSGGTAGRSP